MAQTQTIGKTATKVFTNEEGEKCVKYHNTIVFKTNFEKNLIILNSGGWRTVTTKLRINQALNQFNLDYGVFQKNYEWFVKNYKNSEVVPFLDGIELIIV